MEITACPICGSKNIGIGTLADGIISGLSSWNEVCRDCGYQGASLLFESEAEYKKFIDVLRNAKKQTITQKEITREENEVEEPIGLNREMNEKREVLAGKTIELQSLKKKSYFFEFILAIVLSALFFFILLGSSYISVDNGIFAGKNLMTVIINLLGIFVGVLILFFLIIVFVETIYRSIL